MGREPFVTGRSPDPELEPDLSKMPKYSYLMLHEDFLATKLPFEVIIANQLSATAHFLGKTLLVHNGQVIYPTFYVLPTGAPGVNKSSSVLRYTKGEGELPFVFLLLSFSSSLFFARLSFAA
jgi:hypothetical protein